MTALSLRYHYDGIRLSRGYPVATLAVVHKILHDSFLFHNNTSFAAYRNGQAAAVNLLLSELDEEDIIRVVDHWMDKIQGKA